MMNASAPTGRNSRNRARNTSPSGSCWRTRRAVRLGRARRPRRGRRPGPIGTCWRDKSRHGSQVHGRPITRTAWDSTRASCCAAWTHDTEAWANSSTRRSPRRWGDVYIRLPETIPNSRLAAIQKASIPRMMLANMGSLPMMRDFMNVNSPMQRAVYRNPGPWLPLDGKTIYARDLEVPSSGGVGTARAIAQAYCVFACGGKELGLRRETFQALLAPPSAPRHGSMMKSPKEKWPFRSAS